MKNLKNAFPNTPASFQEKVNDTLNQIIEEEAYSNMKKHSIFNKKVVIIAVAAALVIGTGAFAGGKIAFYNCSSSSTPTYTSIQSKETMQKVYGFTPVVMDNFTNGYQFKSITTVNASANDEDNKKVKSFKEAEIDYVKGNDKISLYTSTDIQEDNQSKLVDTYKDVKIYYTTYNDKCVPADYKLTEQDKADEASGKYIFSCGGGDKVKITKIQGAAFVKNGISYNFCGLDSTATQTDLIAMAHEIIDAE